jgi:hypothetical protein
MSLSSLSPDILPVIVRNFFRDYLDASSSAAVNLAEGYRWFFVSEVLCQLIAPEFGLSAVVLPSFHQRPIYGCLAALIDVDAEVLAIASREVALASSEVALPPYQESEYAEEEGDE